MGRPPNKVTSAVVRITVPPKVVKYLDDLVDEQWYGSTRAAVAAELIRRQIEELIKSGLLDRRKGPVQETDI